MFTDAGRICRDTGSDKTTRVGPEAMLSDSVGMRGLPVWAFSRIYFCTTPSPSARFCDTPRVTASSPPPRTQRPCRRVHHPGARPGSRSWRPLPGSHREAADGRPAQEALHERSCPLDRGWGGQNPAPVWRAHWSPEHPVVGWRSHSRRGCGRQGFPGPETRHSGIACRPRSLVEKRG